MQKRKDGLWVHVWKILVCLRVEKESKSGEARTETFLIVLANPNPFFTGRAEVCS